MRNLKLSEHNAVPGVPGDGRCIVTENTQGNLAAACGRKLWKLEGGQWLEVMDLFDMDEDEVVSFEAIFGKFCAASKMGQIVTCQLENGSVENVGDIFGGIQCAKWSPDLELLVVVTGKGQLLLMRENFDTVVEQELETEELGEKSAITVGWGKKETQFHGSEGKKAAKTLAVQRQAVADFDDRSSYVVWRTDGQHFADTVHENMRKIRVWSRDGILGYTAENIPRLHGGLAWWWGDENLIVSTDTSEKGQRRVVFYETNGLRHGEFELPRNYVVRDISQGTMKAVRVLTLWCSEEDSDVILVYTMNNYHWYPKQTLKFQRRVRGIIWDSHENLRILAGERHYHYKWVFSVDHDGSGSVASIDGDRLLVTDLSKCIIPPPMAGSTLVLPQPVNQVALSEHLTVALTADGSIHFLDRDGVRKGFLLPDQFRNSLIHLTCLNETKVLAVHSSDGSHRLITIDLAGETVDKYVELAESPECLCVSDASIWVKFKKSITQFSNELETLGAHPSFMGKIEQLLCCARKQINVGFNASERIVYLNDQELCASASSVVLHDDAFILVTTLDNTLRTYPLICEQNNCCDSRQLEIGSLLVTSVPTDGRVILQMPRGNLETIYPRPLLLRDIHEQLSRGKFAEAFRLMKVNRINLNLFYDDDPDAFNGRVEDIVDQICNSADLNLLVMDLKEEDVTKTMYKSYYSLLQRPKNLAVKDIAQICDTIRDVCLRKDAQKLHLSVIACHAKKNKVEDLEEALQWISKDEERFDEALKYLLLLVDVKQLMDVALGLYDFKLFLKVAQFSQVDPKEYLALLREMKSYEDENYRNYKIDLHLKRYEKALKNIAKCPDHFAECLELVIKERLHNKSRSLFPRHSLESQALASAHAEYLFAKKYCKDAAIMFMQAREYQRASQCFERALCVELCLEASRLARKPLEPIVKRIIATLVSLKRNGEAGALMKRFNYPAEDVCSTFIDGGCWEEAFCNLHLVPSDRQDYQRQYLEDTLLSQIKVSEERVCYLSMKLDNFVKRLSEVRETKVSREADRINFYDDSDFPMSEAGSMISGASGRRSAASSAKSGSITTLQTNKQIRKAKKPRYTLKVGSPYEDLAIVQECIDIIERVKPLHQDIVPMLYASQLLRVAEDAVRLQNEFSKLLHRIRDSYLSSIWPEIPEGEPQVISDAALRTRPDLSGIPTTSSLLATLW
ncbi:elongator complex protein 1 [Galendromus occidentalis]|uniref:Elongator complex protein 1 n=1 Tax=Galendromus occidentalis TaxID=34638 RepID=A0AAJ7PAB1_9ACAR|nr:elongator complex protein 1 [Galendromus occidentalis]